VTGCCCVVSVTNSKNIHTIDWNRGFESRIGHVYTHTGSCVLFFCVGGGIGVGQPLIRVLRSLRSSFGIESGTKYMMAEEE